MRWAGRVGGTGGLPAGRLRVQLDGGALVSPNLTTPPQGLGAQQRPVRTGGRVMRAHGVLHSRARPGPPPRQDTRDTLLSALRASRQQGGSAVGPPCPDLPHSVAHDTRWGHPCPPGWPLDDPPGGGDAFMRRATLYAVARPPRPGPQKSTALSLRHGEGGGTGNCAGGGGCCERPRRRLALTLTPSHPSRPPRRPNPSPSQSLPGQHPPGAAKPVQLLIFGGRGRASRGGRASGKSLVPWWPLCPAGPPHCQPAEHSPGGPGARGSPGRSPQTALPRIPPG